ncbi:hypothetical protein [Streptomyces sp. CB03911]|uniref:hypothetical protein n=1 Tax=Streptomyces sp. CB03911 TaxID=1804758 RepID=UPI00093D095A|nr:hypothetical protein [Streptomyces sp. CB03911]OKI22221.1 hypothetical protein A6A07_34675 [Streptomyces sp. CB03911]
MIPDELRTGLARLAQARTAALPTAADASAALGAAWPSEAELRYVGAEAHIARIRAELDAQLGRTWRGRLAGRLSHWIARARRL